MNLNPTKNAFPGKRTLAFLARSLLGSLGYDYLPKNRRGQEPFRDIASVVPAGGVRTVFDVGANDGETALAAAKAFPQAEIHSFEPFDETFQRLSNNVRDYTRIRPVLCALGDKAGTMPLNINSASQTNSLLPNSRESQTFQPEGMAIPKGVTPVQILTLDEYCAREKVSFIDVLKIDTQGFDLRVLHGANGLFSEDRVSFVMTEMNFVPLYDGQAYFDQIASFMRSKSFQLVGLYNLWYSPERYLTWCDALFVKPEVIKRAGSR